MLGPFIGILIVIGDTVYQTIRKICKISNQDTNESKERIIVTPINAQSNVELVRRRSQWMKKIIAKNPKTQISMN